MSTIQPAAAEVNRALPAAKPVPPPPEIMPDLGLTEAWWAAVEAEADRLSPSRRPLGPAAAAGDRAARAALDVIKARDLVDDYRTGRDDR